MGCDIHSHIEVKIKGKWHYYDEVNISRNYRLFSRMADIRNEENIIPLSTPKGLPKDITFMTKLKSDYWDTDGHSHSWLSSKELFYLEEWIERNKILPDLAHKGFFFGSTFSGWIKYPEDTIRLRELGVEDFRLVFWFDN